MANITASMVKELREKTSAGMLDCKKALDACDGDMEKAVTWLDSLVNTLTRRKVIFSPITPEASRIIVFKSLPST